MQVLGTLICGTICFNLSIYYHHIPELLAGPQTGIASVYSNEKTANGEYAHAARFTAAHNAPCRSAPSSRSPTSGPAVR